MFAKSLFYILVIVIITALVSVFFIYNYNVSMNKNDSDRSILVKIDPVKDTEQFLVTVVEKIPYSSFKDTVSFYQIVPLSKYDDEGKNSSIKSTNIPLKIVVGNKTLDLNLPLFEQTQLHTVASCNGNERNLFFSQERIIPIKNTEQDISIIYSDYYLNSLDKKTYDLQFTSFYKAKISLPSNTKVITEYHDICQTNYKGYTTMYFYSISFELNS